MDESEAEMPPAKRRKTRRKPQIVALKKIYVTSSPHRIMNELELLHELRHSPYICPLLTAFRHLDQVVAVLPYFRHLDFRLYYREFLINDMRHYFRCLLHGLKHVHQAGILHRDIKPTNFLYDHSRRSGVLVDFGLAESQGTDWQPCLCQEASHKRRDRFMNSYAVRCYNLRRTCSRKAILRTTAGHHEGQIGQAHAAFGRRRSCSNARLKPRKLIFGQPASSSSPFLHDGFHSSTALTTSMP